MRLTDTHCHLDLDAFEEDRDEVLERAWAAGLERILIPGLDLDSSRGVVDLAQADSRLYAAVGVHPNSATSWTERTRDVLKELAQRPEVVALGEIGLDYYWDRAPRDLQKRVLRAQLHLALEVDLPVVLHVRNTDKNDRTCIFDLIHILTEWHREAAERKPDRKRRLGVVHSFSGNREEAQTIQELGFYLGITGPVTFKNAVSLQEVAASVKKELLLIETDAPYLTPHPYRGRRNEPAHVEHVAKKIGQLRGQPSRAVAEQTFENAERLFQWSRSG